MENSKKSIYFNEYRLKETTDSDRIIYTPSLMAKNNLMYVQETGYLKSLKTHTSSRKNIDSFLFLVVTRGSGTVVFNGKSFYLNQGDSIFIDCRKPYSHRSSKYANWELMWVHFNGIGVEQYFNIFESTHENLVVKSDGKYERMIEEISNLIKNKTSYSEFIISNILNNLLTDIISYRHDNIRQKNTAYEKIVQIKDYIDSNYPSKITLDNLASQFYISKYYLAREFKNHFGDTVINYIINRRISEAKGLLRFTDMSVSEVAERCGISDPSFFNKTFKKSEGITATQYRKKWRGKK